MKYLPLISPFLLIAMMYSCNKMDMNKTMHHEFWSSQQKQVWDSTSIAKNLLGEGRLKERYCCPEFSQMRDLEDEKYKPFFDSVQVLVYENGKLVQTTSWSVNNVEEQNFSLESNPYVSNTSGIFLFKDNKALFSVSPFDVTDDYFERK